MNIADLNAEVRALCDANSTSYQDADLLRRINAAYEQVVGKLIGLDGTWQFDDSNFTDLPIGLATLVAGQQDYSFPNTFLEVERLSVLDANSIWHELDPIDKTDISGDLAEYQKTSGLPLEYDKQGGSVFLYPAPSASAVTLTSGLKVYFQRTAAVFTSAEVATGTKTPGFASPFHIVLAYMAALPYCMTYKKDRVAMLQSKITEILGDDDRGIQGTLARFYGRREKDVRKRITTAPISHR